ncbi:hypothetical protein PR202_ga14323 [Eleusine coracana subsp. coracana]|uniref:Uncharacterized protein n=1 Tax=Eleusine coracana subsp. coracana TaxID=191504 RepID=A0AAV5CH75_ELECO|nr:hypothetical protein PR202_ga14323 [Eleusine coracana subsp. coracana]
MVGQGHVRCASVSCHYSSSRQPAVVVMVMQVEEQLAALRSWTSNPGQNPLSLAHVRALLCLLDDLLLLLTPHNSSSQSSESNCLLDGFLVLADAFGSFLAALLALRQYAADLRAAVRRRDPAKVASAARRQRQVGKELQQLSAATSSTRARMSDNEVVRTTVAQAINDTAVASASVFLQLGALADKAASLAIMSSPTPASSSSSSTSKKKKHIVLTSSSKTKQQQQQQQQALLCDDEQRQSLEKLQELDHCIGELESETEKVFRSLVQIRVSMLNIHTPSF